MTASMVLADTPAARKPDTASSLTVMPAVTGKVTETRTVGITDDTAAPLETRIKHETIITIAATDGGMTTMRIPADFPLGTGHVVSATRNGRAACQLHDHTTGNALDLPGNYRRPFRGTLLVRGGGMLAPLALIAGLVMLGVGKDHDVTRWVVLGYLYLGIGLAAAITAITAARGWRRRCRADFAAYVETQARDQAEGIARSVHRHSQEVAAL